MLIVAPASTEAPGVVLRTRLTGFAGFLRANGFGVAGHDAAGILETAERVGALDREVLRWSLKALLCGRGDEWRRFDALFDAYFLPPNRRAVVAGLAPAPPDAGRATGDDDLPDAGHGDEAAGDEGIAERLGASRLESLASTDFGELSDTDRVHDLEALMRRFARRMKRLQLRREARTMHGRRIDLRGTLRRSVGSGGTPFRLAWKDRRRIRPRLVLILDVSRSMSRYSFFWLRLARCLCAELADVRAFVFHTRLADVGAALSDPDPWRSQERLHLIAEGWGGGTRIGECLGEFNRGPAQRLVHTRTAVIVVSDGYDTGDPAELSAELQRLRRRARRVVWFNPLLDRPGFSPVSGGMQAAMPHLDLLAPGANLSSIERALPDLVTALR